VHLPVAFVPLTALGAVLIVLVPRWRRSFGPVVALFALVGAIGMQLAYGSGDELKDRIDINQAVEEHIDLATTARPLVFAFCALVLAFLVVAWRLDRRRSGGRKRAGHPAVLALGALVLVGAVLATVWTLRTGHQGADAVWRGTGETGPGG
jgi:TRAP-type C4-dicarboxylate transport system permease small subunit